MFYSGIALALLGCFLLITQLMGMKKQNKLAEEAARILDVAPVAVASPSKAAKDPTSISTGNAYDSTIKLQNVQFDIDGCTVKLSNLEDAGENEAKPDGIRPD